MVKRLMQNTRQIMVRCPIDAVQAFFDMHSAQYISFWTYVGAVSSQGADTYEVFFDYDPTVHPFYKLKWNRMRPRVQVTLQSAGQGTMLCFTDTSVLKCIHMLLPYFLFAGFGLYQAICDTGPDRWTALLLTHIIFPVFYMAMIAVFRSMCKSIVSGLNLWMKDQNR